MSGLIYHVGVTAMCGHGGQISAVASTPRVTLGGQPAVTFADMFPIAGCAFNISGSPHPCVKVQWLVPAARVRVSGQPVILQTSTGLTVAANQAPQGSPIVISGQIRARAT
jgi:hypothetical protein